MLDFPIHNYPTNAETDPEVLYRSLGSFWTTIFRDKAVLKGYTLGLAEELIQRYYDLTEAVNSYSVKDVPVFHKEKWKPIVMYRSKFGNAPFVFEQDGATFGEQSVQDKYYANVVFQFGFPKRPIAQVYLFDVGKEFKDFGVITDKIFNPSMVLVKGTDVILQNGVLYFNRNVFDDPAVERIDVISENGEAVTYIDESGNIQNEQMIILWAYHAETDQNILFNSFGYIFNLNRTNDKFFKDLLKAVFGLYVNGPTVHYIKSVCASFLNIKPVLEKEETITEIFDDGKYKFVVTDKHAYKFERNHAIKQDVIVGRAFQQGDIFVDSIDYYDNVQTPNWWKSSSTLKNKLAVSQYIFLGNYQSQLIFLNDIDLVTLDSVGNIVFPVEGDPADVTRFNAQLNSNIENKAKIKEKLGIANPGDGAPIIPVDFLMENFLKNNTAFIKFKFMSTAVQAQFLSLLPILRSQLPPYVYVIFGLELQVNDEVYEKLNGATSIEFDSGVETLNADGSNEEGFIENLAPYGYRDLTARLFAISLALPAQPYEIVAASDTSTILENLLLTEAGETILTEDSIEIAIDTGSPLTYVTMKDGAPLKVPAPGQSTAQFSKLQLLDFI